MFLIVGRMRARGRRMALGLAMALAATILVAHPALSCSAEEAATARPVRAADPSQLPIAAGQVPLFQRYVGGTLRAGASYPDPVTRARVTKLTDSGTPIRNEKGLHHYASGPAQISRAWGDGFHTINVTAGGRDYLVDYRRGGSIANWRPLEVSGPDLSFTFSLDPATARMAFVVRDRKLQRFDTARMVFANNGRFPKDFSALGDDYLVWLQTDQRDEWFVMMLQNGGRVVAWNSKTDQLRVLSVVDLDEPHLERDGRYIFVARESDWLIWDLRTNTQSTPRRTPFRGHPGAFRSLFAASEGDNNPATLWRHDPATGKSATIWTGEQSGNGGQHRADQWIMPDAELRGDLTRQWFLQTVHDEGEANAGEWRRQQGEVFVATVRDWGAAYGKPGIGIRAIRQTRANDPTSFMATLTSVPNENALSEGTFHYDAETSRVFVWMRGGGNPSGRVAIKSPALVHDAMALLRLDGSEARLLAHHYSLDAERQYDAMPKATISPDGQLVVFSSNMNDSDGRVDVFAVELPVR